jgi:plasmid maintenance system antidote protein VapI
MSYTFDILGVAPLLYFFHQQEEIIETNPQLGVEYLGCYKCTLDCFIESVEPVIPKRGWDFQQVVDTTIDFWMNHAETIGYWKARLEDAGKDNLLVARIANMKGLQQAFESLLDKT